MKKQTLALMWVGACICLSSLSLQAQKIMPFGDSVTSRGSDPESSYRYWLWQDLQNAGFTGVTFIGQQSGVTGGGPPAHTDFDQSFEGGESLTSADALSMAPAAATWQGGPDIVLLDFGSNDIIGEMDLNTQTRANLQQIIETFAAQNGNVVILIAKPTPFAVDRGASPAEQKRERSQQSKLAGIVSQVAKTEQAAGVRVITVDLFSGFSVKSDTDDGAHPNVKGEQKIAKKFFSALKKVL